MSDEARASKSDMCGRSERLLCLEELPLAATEDLQLNEGDGALKRMPLYVILFR